MFKTRIATSPKRNLKNRIFATVFLNILFRQKSNNCFIIFIHKIQKKCKSSYEF